MPRMGVSALWQHALPIGLRLKEMVISKPPPATMTIAQRYRPVLSAWVIATCISARLSPLLMHPELHIAV